MDLYDWSVSTSNYAITRFQNNIQSIFSRVRLLYGSTPIEDIINYNVIVRALTEWTGTTQIGTMDQTSISDGIGGVVYGLEGDGGAGFPKSGLVNIRQAYIQGIDNSVNTTANGTAALPTGDGSAGSTLALLNKGNGFGSVPNVKPATESTPKFTTRRYQVNLALGLFTQEKLIPTKFMASQLAIELTLETDAACLFTIKDGANLGNPPTYRVHDVNLIPEILEFDASYGKFLFRSVPSMIRVF